MYSSKIAGVKMHAIFKNWSFPVWYPAQVHLGLIGRLLKGILCDGCTFIKSNKNIKFQDISDLKILNTAFVY